MFWKNITAAETDKLLEEMKQKGEVQEPICHTQSDRRKKQKRLPDEDKDTEDEQDQDGGNGSSAAPRCHRLQKCHKNVISGEVIDSGNSDDAYSDGDN